MISPFLQNKVQISDSCWVSRSVASWVTFSCTCCPKPGTWFVSVLWLFIINKLEEITINKSGFSTTGNDSNRGQVQLGMWLIAGLFAFALLERLLSSTAEAAEDNESSQELAQQEDEDSDTQNNNDPCDKKRQEKKDFTKRKNSAPPSQLSLLNPFHGMSSKQVRTKQTENQRFLLLTKGDRDVWTTKEITRRYIFFDLHRWRATWICWLTALITSPTVWPWPVLSSSRLEWDF